MFKKRKNHLLKSQLKTPPCGQGSLLGAACALSLAILLALVKRVLGEVTHPQGGPFWK